MLPILITDFSLSLHPPHVRARLLKHARNMNGERVIRQDIYEQLIKADYGLGDWVAVKLAPIVRGTRFENCGGCKRRASKLNKFGQSLQSWTRRIFKWQR